MTFLAPDLLSSNQDLQANPLPRYLRTGTEACNLQLEGFYPRPNILPTLIPTLFDLIYILRFEFTGPEHPLKRFKNR